jgi:hypothetical protein
LRAAFGTLSEEFADTMMGKIISGLRPNAYHIPGEATRPPLLPALGEASRRSRSHGCASRHRWLFGATHDETSQRYLKSEHHGPWRLRQPAAKPRPTCCKTSTGTGGTASPSRSSRISPWRTGRSEL